MVYLNWNLIQYLFAHLDLVNTWVITICNNNTEFAQFNPGLTRYIGYKLFNMSKLICCLILILNLIVLLQRLISPIQRRLYATTKPKHDNAILYLCRTYSPQHGTCLQNVSKFYNVWKSCQVLSQAVENSTRKRGKGCGVGIAFRGALFLNIHYPITKSIFGTMRTKIKIPIQVVTTT